MNQNIVYPKFRWFVLLMLGFVTMASSVVLISPAPLVSVIAKDLGLSLGETTGMMMGPFTFCVAISCILGGVIIDRIGIIKVFIGSLILLIAGGLLTPVIGNTLGGLLFIRVIGGFGTGPIMATLTTVAAQWFPSEERGIVTGTQGMSVGFGVALGFVAAPAFFTMAGTWQAGMAWLSIFSIIGLILTIIVAVGPKAPEVVNEMACEVAVSSGSDYKLALGQLVTWLCVIGIFVNSWANQAFNDLTPGYLAIEAPIGLGMGPMTAGQYMMIYQLAFMVGSVLCGIVMKKVFNGNARPVLLICSILAAVFALSVKLPIIYSNSTALLICLILTGLFLSSINPTIQAFISMHYPKSIIGKIGGMAMGIGIFGGTAGVAAGSVALHTTGTYQLSILIVAAILLVGFVFALGMKPPKGFGASNN